MITITLLILFDRKKYENIVHPALKDLRQGNIDKVEQLTSKIDKSIVVDFWDFSDIPEEDKEFSGFFEDFIYALEQEIIQKNKLPDNINRTTLRKMIIDMVKGSTSDEVMLPDEIIKRISGLTNFSKLQSDTIPFQDSNDFNEIENELQSFIKDELPDKDEELGILEHEMEDIIAEVKKEKKADADTIMYFKARLIEAFCIPINKVRYRYDLSGNLLNVFLYSLSDKAFQLLKKRQECDWLEPHLNPNDEEIAEDIFARYLGKDNIIDFMAILDSLTMNYSENEDFDNINKILRRNIKGEWWNRMNEAEKRIRINNWWKEMETLKMFLQGALDHGYDIIISTI